MFGPGAIEPLYILTTNMDRGKEAGDGRYRRVRHDEASVDEWILECVLVERLGMEGFLFVYNLTTPRSLLHRY